MSVSAVSPNALKDQIIEMAMKGTRPREIAASLSPHCNYQKVANTIAQARRDGMPIPKFRDGSSRRQPRTPVAAASIPAPAERKTQALDYFELRALKKLLGADLAAIEMLADGANLSVGQYVCEVLRGHVRRFQG